MEAVVWLALLVLAAVFVLSLCVLLMLCKKRRYSLTALHSHQNHLRFSKLQNDNIESLIQLNPLLERALEGCSDWADDAEGVFSHILSILRLTAFIVKKLSLVDLSKCPPRLYEVICEAMSRIGMHFDELASFQPTCPGDIRVIEARATTLVTVVWALVSPFTLYAPAARYDLTEAVKALYAHIDELRLIASTMEKEAACSASSLPPMTSLVESPSKKRGTATGASSDDDSEGSAPPPPASSPSHPIDPSA